jgi:epoxyqueuosine reductase
MGKYIALSIVKDLALNIGFQDCGAAKVEPLDSAFFDNWLKEGFNANMLYMQNYYTQRLNPSLLLDGAETIFCFVLSYNTNEKTNNHYKIASYAFGKDYHRIIKNKLKDIVAKIKESYPDFEAKVFVDTAPIFEKVWAKKAGLGWIGNNSCLVTKDFGSKVFIGEIICNFSSDYAKEEVQSKCGNCNKCIEICPNKALDTKTINSNLCNAYQTIENKEPIPSGINLHNFVFGCDICLDVCPYNNKTFINEDKDMKIRDEVKDLLNKIDDGSIEKSDFQKARKNSSIERIKFEKLLSNLRSASLEGFNDYD